MPSPRSDQDFFAADLKDQSRGGITIYHPLEYLPHSGRVGDIGFFDLRGNYVWVQNAFHDDVF